MTHVRILVLALAIVAPAGLAAAQASSTGSATGMKIKRLTEAVVGLSGIPSRLNGATARWLGVLVATASQKSRR